ncbi:SRPBCC domain-containing protein, partial [Mesorhizobium sp. M8A.F.Ca.ET.213.01.1.1]|uniref:SRPBCC domain-containing protein n=1 Tax=Mesorhizobium sp. M8A.F.Ca.ET.213.01.1.1 TaxID=2563970 RepID=UPI0016778A4F
TETRSVVVEREIPYPPEKIWRALTQPHLIEEWLMKNNFKPVVDHRFSVSADWGGVDSEYSANLDAKVDMGALCELVSRTILETGLFEQGAVRVRAFRADAYAIAD